MEKVYCMVEDPSKVPPEEKYPVMSQVDVDLIRSYIRESNKDNPQKDGIWYEYKELSSNPFAIPYYRLEDEDGYSMIFHANHYTLDQCFEKFKKNKEEDPDWNYGKNLKTKNQ